MKGLPNIILRQKGAGEKEDKFYIQLFDEDAYEEKIEMHHFNNINKKDLEIKLNKKIKVFE